MPTPSTTYLSCRPSGAGRALFGISLASLSRLVAGVYDCVCFVGKATTEEANKARAETVAGSVKRMVTRSQDNVKVFRIEEGVGSIQGDEEIFPHCT